MEDIKALAAKIGDRLRMTEAEKIDNTGWYTSREFAEAWGVSQREAADRLCKAVEMGLMVCEKRPKIRTDGQIQKYAMYREVAPD